MKNNIVWHPSSITKKDRAKKLQQKPCVLWFTGLSGSGKSTLANALEVELYTRNITTYLLDGDNVRHGLNKDLTFSEADRVENIRRVAEVAKLFVDSGVIVLTAFISPFHADRELAKNLFENGEFIEVFVNTPLEVCEQRDPKGLYSKARKGEIKNFTGLASPYEAPDNPQIEINTATTSIEQGVAMLFEYLHNHNYIRE